MNLFSTLEGKLRLAGFAEAISWLLLLFWAMPLKYIWADPLPVKRVGWIHGIFFIAYFLLLSLNFIKHRWPMQKMIRGIFFSFLPFGTLYFDRELKH